MGTQIYVVVFYQPYKGYTTYKMTAASKRFGSCEVSVAAKEGRFEREVLFQHCIHRRNDREW
jgi:hypothetical protein